MEKNSTGEYDHYEQLQISANAEPETIHRVYRLLAARFHPDNTETGDESRFRAISEAYQVLSDPEQRARYDIGHEQRRQQRWRLVSQSARPENDFEAEQIIRMTVLEVLYARRRTEPVRAEPLAARRRRNDGDAARAPRVHDLVSAAEEIRHPRG